MIQMIRKRILSIMFSTCMQIVAAPRLSLQPEMQPIWVTGIWQKQQQSGTGVEYPGSR